MIEENQTQFIEDQVLWQDQTHTVPQHIEVPTQIPLHTPEQKKKKLLIIGGSIFGGLFVLTLIMMMVMGIGRNSMRLVPETTPKPIVKQEDDAFTKAFKLLQQDIVKADPTTGDLPFPPVNPALYIAREN